jgi:hypothetical protein
MKIALKYSAGLIAIYLLVFNATNSGTVLSDSSTAASGLVRAFQGQAKG